MTDTLAPATVAELRSRPLIQRAVLHLANDQPLLIDLFGLPSPADPVLVCTNLRSMTGARPVWADDTASVYFFPWAHIRFVEIPPAAHERPEALPALPAPATATPPVEAPEFDFDVDFEIDEDFLRRVREV